MMYRGISGELLRLDEELSISGIVSKIDKIVSSISLHVIEGDNQKASLGLPLPLPITVRAVFNSNDKIKIPVSDVKLQFKITKGSGVLSESGVTDKNGMAKATIFKVEASGIKENIVEASINWDELIDDVIRAKPVIAHARYFLPMKEDFKIGVIIIEKIMGEVSKERQIESSIIEKLKKNGFAITQNIPKSLSNEKIINIEVTELTNSLKDRCNLLVLGLIDTRKKSELYEVFFTEAWGDVRVINISDGSLFTTINVQPSDTKKSTGYDTKGSGIDYSTASIKSLKKTGDIVSKLLPDIIDKAINSTK